MRLSMKSIGSTMGQAAKPADSLAKQFALFALLVALWGMNLFPVQRAQQVLTASALVSSQRLESLQSVAKQKRIQSDSIRWIHYQRDLKRTSHHSISTGVEHVHLRIGILPNTSAEKLQSELVRLTEPSIETIGTQDALAKLRSERWRLATVEHQMALFELDRTREKHAQETAILQDEAMGAEESPTPARTVVHRKINADSSSQIPPSSPETASDPSSHRATWESLLSEFDRSAERIERIESDIRSAKNQASGTIAITGSPRVGVLSTPASVSQSLCVAAFTLMGCVGLGLYLRGPVPNRVTSNRQPSSGASLSKQLLEKLPMTNFGTIFLERSSAPLPVQEIPVGTSIDGAIQARRIKLVRRLADGLLVVWSGLFAIRFLSDASWRELLFSAPLSAFSSLVFGV